MYIYLELPEGKVPRELIVGTKTVVGITLSMKARDGIKSKVVMDVSSPDRGAKSRLYGLNKPIEEIHADLTKMVTEALVLRSSMATLASMFGFDSYISTAGNGLGWEALSRKVEERARQLDDHVSASLEDLGLKRPRRKTRGRQDPGRS
jgi:hypothetical protein